MCVYSAISSTDHKHATAACRRWLWFAATRGKCSACSNCDMLRSHLSHLCAVSLTTNQHKPHSSVSHLSHNQQPTIAQSYVCVWACAGVGSVGGQAGTDQTGTRDCRGTGISC